MKTPIRALLLSVAFALCALSGNARTAVLVAHYGSSDPDTRSKTISLITADIRASLPASVEVREAYISPVVRKRLLKAGENIPGPTEALIRLCADGYDSVYVQSTTLIDGTEMAEVRQACERMSQFFSLLRCGTSLCHTPDDCAKLTAILGVVPRAKDEAVIYVGHGNLLPSTATYAQLDYMLAAAGHEALHVSTIEGYPTAASTITQLRRDGKHIKRARLIPLLLVCGNHTKNDIAVDFASALNSAGYTTEVVMHGLGESPAVRALYVARILALLQ